MTTTSGVVGDVQRDIVTKILFDTERDLLDVRSRVVQVGRKARRKDRKREAGCEKVLIHEQRVRIVGIEPLLVGDIVHAGRTGAQAARISERPLKRICGIQIQRTGCCDGCIRDARRSPGEDHKRNRSRVEGDGLRFKVAGCAIVKDAVVRANNGLGIAANVIRNPNARLDVGWLQANSLADPVSAFRGVGIGVDRELGGEGLNVVADTEVQRNFAADAPAILQKGAEHLQIIFIAWCCRCPGQTTAECPGHKPGSQRTPEARQAPKRHRCCRANRSYSHRRHTAAPADRLMGM